MHTSLRLPLLERACARASSRVSYTYNQDPSAYSGARTMGVGRAPSATAAAAVSKYALLPLQAEVFTEECSEAVWELYSAARASSSLRAKRGAA